MFSRRQAIVLCLGAAAKPGLASAHRQKQTFTEVIWQADSQTLDITHRFHIHEAETALASAGLIMRPDLTKLEARAHLALYVEENFTLQTLDRVPLPLTLIGAEIESRTAYVYQQIALSHAPVGFIVTCNLMRELIPDQINHVDINLTGEIRSLIFQGKDGPKRMLA